MLCLIRAYGSEKLFTIPGDIWIYTLSEDPDRHERLATRGATVIQATEDAAGRIDLTALLQDLAQREINDVHSECGQRLAGALIDQQLADQVVLYLAPHLLGSAARGVFDLGELTAMEQRKTCSMRDVRQIGEDLRLTLSVD